MMRLLGKFSFILMLATLSFSVQASGGTHAQFLIQEVRSGRADLNELGDYFLAEILADRLDLNELKDLVSPEFFSWVEYQWGMRAQLLSEMQRLQVPLYLPVVMSLPPGVVGMPWLQPVVFPETGLNYLVRPPLPPGMGVGYWVWFPLPPSENKTAVPALLDR